MNSHSTSRAEHGDYAHFRASFRFPPYKSEISLIVGDQQKSATLLNASYGGVGVMMEMADAADVQVGDLLIVLQGDSRTPGRVRWVQHSQSAQLVRFGICWSD